MKQEFEELANIFAKMRTLCNKCALTGSDIEGLQKRVEAMGILKDTMRKVEGCMRDIRKDLRAEIGNMKKTEKRKALGSPKPKSPKAPMKKPKPKPRPKRDGFFAGKVKEIPDYSHSDFKNLEEYIEYMRRPPISDKETKEVDWDEEFK